MPVPSLVTDLSTTAASNSPAGSDNVFPDLDNYLRALSAFVASVRDNSGNGWVSPYLALSGGTVSGSTTFSGALSLTGSVSGVALTNYLAAPAAIGGTTPAAGSFTTLSASSTVTLNGGTANGVGYLNASKVLTSGSALTWNGTGLGVGIASASGNLDVYTAATSIGYVRTANQTLKLTADDAGNRVDIANVAGNPVSFTVGVTEAMRLTTTGLGIGTSSPSYRLDVRGTSTDLFQVKSTGAYTFNRFQSSSRNWALSISSSFDVYDETAAATRMSIDSSGNLGLGVTPSAWNSTRKALQLSSGSVFANSTTIIELGQNFFINSGGSAVYTNNGFASDYAQQSGQHQWFTAPSGTAGNAITFTQAMTLDASGRLGIGTTSPIYPLVVSAAGAQGIEFDATAVSSAPLIQAYNRSGAAYIQLTYSALQHVWTISGTERARITSGGDLLVGVTSGTRHWLSKSNAADYAVTLNNSNANPLGAQIYHNTDSNGAGNQFLDCQGAGNVRAQIRSNGGIANYQANDVNLSDRREKTNFAPAKDYLDTICAIPVQTFNYIDQSEDDPGLTLGVVAQDVQAVAPELVQESNWGTEDEPRMRLSVYQTDLQYALMKAIQEQQALITNLTARVAQLERQP